SANSLAVASEAARPMVTTCMPITSGSADSMGRKKSAMHSRRSRRGRGGGEAAPHPLAAAAVPDDHVVAVAVAGEVAIDDRRAQDLAGDGLVQQGPQTRPGPGVQGRAPAPRRRPGGR